jgi:CO/xanthine dehydrogenase FAD-binding subunit
MDVLQPRDLNEALAMKAERPDAVLLAGGTDLMVELNFDMRRPEVIMDLTRVPELVERSRDDGVVRIGAGVSYTDLIADLAIELPGLAIASRTIGSPQIRNRGTIGGNLGTASPAGDTLPVLLAANAEVEIASAQSARRLALGEFITGPKKNALGPDEIITATLVPAATGPQQFSKIGTRNAMVIAVASFAIVLDPPAERVGTGIGSAGPTPLRAGEAERFLSEYIAERDLWEKRGPIEERAAARFGELAAASAKPIDDVRGSARYRRHSVAIMARRTLMWAWSEFRKEGVRGHEA